MCLFNGLQCLQPNKEATLWQMPWTCHVTGSDDIYQLHSTSLAGISEDVALQDLDNTLLTPMTWMSSELLMTPLQEQIEEPEPAGEHSSEDGLSEPDIDGELESIWTTNKITKESIVSALNDRIRRRLDMALLLKGGPRPEPSEYLRLARVLASSEAKRYNEKRRARECGTVSMPASSEY